MIASSPPKPADTTVHRIGIVGVGLLCPLDPAATGTFRKLLQGVRHTDRLTRADPDMPAPATAVERVQRAGVVACCRHDPIDPVLGLAEQAARQAAIDAGWTGPARRDGAPPPIILGASKGAVLTWGRAARRHTRAPGASTPLQPVARDDPAEAVALGPVGLLARGLGRRLAAPVLDAHVAACASGLVALHRATRRMQHEPELDRLLVVAADAALDDPWVTSYRRLGALAPLDRDRYEPRPLDAAARGFTLAEQGAAVALQRFGPDDAPPRHVVWLTATAEASDAHDMVRPSPDHAALAAVVDRLLAAEPNRHASTVDLLHPHAPGLGEPDIAEMAVYRQRLGEVPWYAVKGAIGHGLGAAGLASLVIACLCARFNRRPPMTWLDRPTVPAPPLNRPVLEQLVFASGFGGSIAGARLQRDPQAD